MKDSPGAAYWSIIGTTTYGGSLASAFTDMPPISKTIKNANRDMFFLIRFIFSVSFPKKGLLYLECNNYSLRVRKTALFSHSGGLREKISALLMR
jgi:hypothetical protein